MVGSVVRREWVDKLRIQVRRGTRWKSYCTLTKVHRRDKPGSIISRHLVRVGTDEMSVLTRLAS
jgi:hypothetical protein